MDQRTLEKSKYHEVLTRLEGQENFYFPGVEMVIVQVGLDGELLHISAPSTLNFADN